MINTEDLILHQTFDKSTNYLEFDGTSSDYVEMSDIDPTGSMSFTFWIQSDYVTDRQGIISSYHNHGKYAFACFTDTNGKLNFYLGSDDSSWSTILVSDTDVCNISLEPSWHFITCTYDESNMRIYVDGELDNSVAETSSVGSGASPTFLGRCTYTNTVVAYSIVDSAFTGSMRSVSIWNKELTSTEVVQYMNKDPIGTENDLIAFWALDEGTGTTANDVTDTYDGTITGTSWESCPSDSSSYAHFGVSGGDAVHQDSKIGKGYDFSGAGGIVYDVLPILYQQRLTMAFWAKHNNATRSLDGGVAKGKIFGPSTTTQYKIDFHAGTARMYICDGTTVYGDSTGTIDVSTWTHWAMTYDGTDVIAYKNGEVVGSENSGSVTIQDYNASFVVGGNSSVGQYGIDGEIDDVRVYKKALTQSDIKRIMLGMHPLG